MIASKNSFEPAPGRPETNGNSSNGANRAALDAKPNSKRVYVHAQIHRDIRVPMREIQLAPPRLLNGGTEPNEPVRVYDCSGPWGDPEFKGRVEDGLPALRTKWIRHRHDVEEVEGGGRKVEGGGQKAE